jgi:hypothetical protein
LSRSNGAATAVQVVKGVMGYGHRALG